MIPGFKNTTLDVRTSDGLCDELLEPLAFVRENGDVVRAPCGGTTDGWSVPRCLRNYMPADGGDWFAAVLHDSAYRYQLQIKCMGDNWIPARYSRKQADILLLEAMRLQDVCIIKRHVIYWCVRVFGHPAFVEDRTANGAPLT